MGGRLGYAPMNLSSRLKRSHIRLGCVELAARHEMPPVADVVTAPPGWRRWWRTEATVAEHAPTVRSDMDRGPSVGVDDVASGLPADGSDIRWGQQKSGPRINEEGGEPLWCPAALPYQQ